jgi:hypothetical protein
MRSPSLSIFMLFSRSHTDYVKATVVVMAIQMEVVADMVEEVTSTATPVEVDTLTAVAMVAAVAMVVVPVEIACLTSELDFRSRTGVS